MLEISKRIRISKNELKFRTIRSSGPGGQHANKSATAVQLQFDLINSSLPDQMKERLLKLKDKRISSSGLITITARRYRSQEKNKQDALVRLQRLLAKALHTRKKRHQTKPSKSVMEKRRIEKARRARLKQMRKKVDPQVD